MSERTSDTCGHCGAPARPEQDRCRYCGQKLYVSVTRYVADLNALPTRESKDRKRLEELIVRGHARMGIG